MANFLYLFRSEPQAAQLSPEQMEQRLRSWMTWLDELKRDGHLVDTGNRLEPSGKVVHGKTKSITDGPYAEAKDTIGGFIVVTAKDLAQAAELAKGCPILASAGSVEVRPIFAM